MLRLTLTLRAAGNGSSLRVIPSVTPRVVGNLVTYSHAGISEWYRNGPDGIEQGFTVMHGAAKTTGPLVLALAMSTGGTASMDRRGRGLTVAGPGGSVLHYAGLAASDSTGRALRSWLQLEPGALLLKVDTRGAAYPVRIDPLIQQAILGAGETEAALPGYGFGESVALSSDGDTALVGEPANAAAWIYTRSGSIWSRGEKLTPKQPGSAFGKTVALSADGKTALIGDPETNSGIGAAWIFTHTGSTWSEREKLPSGAAIGEEGSGGFGASVALSAAGNVALIGAPNNNTGEGAAWSFTPPNHLKLNLHGESGPECGSKGEAGASVALSADGSRAVIGCAGVGHVLELEHFPSKWTLFDNLEVPNMTFHGDSLSLSASGNTLLVADRLLGEAMVFTRSATSEPWVSQELYGREAQCHFCGFAGGVALSADGSVALVGGVQDNQETGAVWVFRLAGSTWIEQGSKLVGREAGVGFGSGVAVSSDGNTLLVGEPRFPGETFLPGLARVFINPPPSVATDEASDVGASAATLHATINPNERSSRTHFQYGSTTAYGQSTPVQALAAAGVSSALAAGIGGLSPESGYHFRVVAESSAGTSYGADQAFATAPLPPVNLAAPVISGAPLRGAALSVSPGAWSSHPTAFAYQWQICDVGGNNCSNISGATGASHILSQGEVGHRLRAAVTAANALGSGSALSAPSAVVGSYVEVSMTWRFGWTRTYTIVQSLVVHGIPQGARVEMACHGGGCPFRAHSASSSHSRRCHKHKCPSTRRRSSSEKDLTSLFKGSRLRAGARVTVSVVKPGWVGKSYLFTMRSDAEPRYQIAFN
jgi:hypothetical protein